MSANIIHGAFRVKGGKATYEAISAATLGRACQRCARALGAPDNHRTDLAVSKLGRFSSQDREDIAALARHKLISASKLRRRAEDALVGYVGDTNRVQGSIEIAVRIVADLEARGVTLSRR